MAKFENGTRVNYTNAYGAKTPYLRISAGPHRYRYVHELVAEAKIGRPLEPGETVEHLDGNGLNPHWSNLIVVSKPENLRLKLARLHGEPPEIPCPS